MGQKISDTDLQLGNVLREIRQREGWNQRDLARYTGTIQQTVCRMEIGSPTYQQHFSFFMRILPKCIEHDIFTEEHLTGGKIGSHGTSVHHSAAKTSPRKKRLSPTGNSLSGPHWACFDKERSFCQSRLLFPRIM